VNGTLAVRAVRTSHTAAVLSELIFVVGVFAVGLYDAGFPRRNVGEGGMRLYNYGCVSVQAATNWAKIAETHGDVIGGPAVRDLIQWCNDRVRVSG
jgi:hypothetical protein